MDEIEEKPMPTGMEGLEPIRGTQLATPPGIASIALSMALKYYDINTVQEGALYQQYKLEGRNMRDLHLDMVFETAIKIEQHLMFANERISSLLMEVVKDAVIEIVEDDDDTSPAGVSDLP